MKVIFIIDDDKLYISNAIDNIDLELEDVKVITYSSNIRSLFDDKDFNDGDIFFVDKNMFNGKGTTLLIKNDSIDGIELAKEIKEKNPNAKVYINSSDYDIDDYLDKYNLQQDFEESKILFYSDKNIESIIKIIEKH